MTIPDSESSTSETADDRELGELLRQAYDAPPVPRSLLRRIDRIVEQEWGQSPRLADSPADKFQRGIIRGVRWMRTLPIATALVVVALVLTAFYSSQPAYAWSSMVSALEDAGLVEIEQNGVVRWLSMADQLAGESSAHGRLVLDARRNVLLCQHPDAVTVEQQAMGSTGLSPGEQLVLAFLIGDASNPRNIALLKTAEVMHEAATAVEIDGQSQLELSVFLQSAEDEGALQVRVDPKTMQPLSSRFRFGTSASIREPAQTTAAQQSPDSAFLAWRYHPEGADDVSARSQALLSAGRIISVSEFSTPLTTMAQVGKVPAIEPGDRGSSPSVATAGQSAEGRRTAELTDSGSPPRVEGYHGSLQGAASQWKAVELRPSITGSAVQDLDELLAQLWRENQVAPVMDASAEELLRRVYLDLAGRTPSVPEVREFLGDTSPDRYVRLVDRLLGSPDHASHLAAMFRSFLIPEGIDLASFGGIEAFERWLSERFSSGESYDRTVQQLLLAEGRLVKSGPLLFYSATRLEPDQLAGRTARVFLGMRLECAQCHDHPFEPWKQEDFWGFAAFFGQISRPQGKLETVSTVMQVRDVNRGEVTMPDSKAPVAPKFLNASDQLEPVAAVARRKVLTQWLTGKENPYFARATANRVWSMLFGKGIVSPVDDFGVGNPPMSEELLDLLAGQFIQSNFSLRELFRTLALSKAYRLSSGAADVNDQRQEWFAQMNIKMLTAEQVYDCITVATMPSNVASGADGLVERFGNTSREAFLRDFRTPSGRPTEYQGGIPQALTLMNGSVIDSATGLQSSGLLKSLEAPFFSRDQRIEILYYATLARSPGPAEKEHLDQYIPTDLKGPQLREALSDVLWALLNSAEFTMNH